MPIMHEQASFRRGFITGLFAAVVTTLPCAALAQPAGSPDAAPPPPVGEPWPESGNRSRWRGELRDGGRVIVDPRTNRAVVEGWDGHQSQLWDGVHQLEDGSELTVRDGRVVPNQEMMRRRDFTPEPALTREPVPNPDVVQPNVTPESKPPQSAVLRDDPCAVLVRQACGSNDACAEETKCSAARQLVGMAAEERALDGAGSGITGTELNCREALTDSFFAPCDAATSDTDPRQ